MFFAALEQELELLRVCKSSLLSTQPRSSFGEEGEAVKVTLIHSPAWVEGYVVSTQKM